MEALINLSSISDIINVLTFIFALATAVIGLYVYFTKEKENKILLIGLGALFIMLAPLHSILAGISINFLEESLLNPWAGIMTMIGSLLFLIAVEPWKAFK